MSLKTICGRVLNVRQICPNEPGIERSINRKQNVLIVNIEARSSLCQHPAVTGTTALHARRPAECSETETKILSGGGWAHGLMNPGQATASGFNETSILIILKQCWVKRLAPIHGWSERNKHDPCGNIKMILSGPLMNRGNECEKWLFQRSLWIFSKRNQVSRKPASSPEATKENEQNRPEYVPLIRPECYARSRGPMKIS